MRGLRGPAKKRDLVLSWHAWGYWALVVVLGAAAPRLWITLAVLAAAVLFWLFGVVRAALRRDPSLLARLVGLIALALVSIWLLAPADFHVAGVSYWEHWNHRGEVALAVLVVLAGMLFIALIHAAVVRDIWKPRLRPWIWPAVGFPLVSFTALLLLQWSWGLAWCAVMLLAVVWLCGLLWAGDQGSSLQVRLLGLGLAASLVAIWPPVSLGRHYEDIVEAVFRYQMSGSDAGEYVLQIEGHDPTAELQQRLRALASGISIARVDDMRTPRYGVSDHRTFWIESVERSWVNPCAVAVRGGHCTEWSGAGYRYWVAWLAGRWVVVGESQEEEWVTCGFGDSTSVVR